MIQIKNLNKYYHKGKTNEIHVINNTTVTLGDSGLVCILGESGSGKTTLMNTISGLDDFYNGEMEVDGITIRRFGDKNQEFVRNEKFGYIFQNYYLLQDRTVEYNLLLGLSLYDIPEEKKYERIDYVLRAVDMWKYKKRLVSELSGGQQQRIAIARALAKAPKVIFADEPTGNLDEANTMRIMGILKKISKTCLVVVVTHEKSIADFFADRILWILDGTIQKEKDKNGSDTYEYVENTNLYLQEYEKQQAESGNVHLEVYSRQKIPKLKLEVIFQNGKVYLHAKDDAELVFLSSTDEKKMIDAKKPVVEQQDIEDVEFELEHIEGAKRPKMTVREIMDIAKTNLTALGKKRLFLSFALFLVAVLVILTVQDTLGILRISEQELVTTDSHYYLVTAEKNAMITESQYSEYFGNLTTAFLENGLETYIVPDTQLTYQYVGYEQLESADYELKNYFLADIKNLSEEDLIYGTMPQNDQEVVVDRWVLENFIDGSEQVKNAMPKVKSAVGSTITTSKGLTLTISGICETNEPDIYLENDILVMLCNGNMNFRTESKAKLLYDDFTGGDVGIDEEGTVQVLVSDKTLRDRFIQDMIEKYGKLEDAYNVVELLRLQTVYTDEDNGDVVWGEYTPDDARRDFAIKEKEYQDLVDEYGMTAPEYFALLQSDEYLDYSYIGLLTEGVKYVVTGSFPANYGIDYIISDDSCEYLAKTIMDTAKKCYVYADDADAAAMLEKIENIIPEDAASNLTITITNEYQDVVDAYKTARNQKLGMRILMTVTILAISMIILYFMMKANAVARMQDLGVYRMIGISKGSIVGMFAYENFILTSTTTLPGALLTIFVTYVLAQIPLMESSFYFPWYLFAAVVLVLYLVNIIIGILPIRRMLKLPPAQLAAKYDI